MATAIPEDILVLFTQHWLPIHAVSSTISGKLIAALSSPAGVKSHLAGEFDLQEHWDPAANLGNPMHSMQIGDMINGFHDEAAEPGYQKRGAVLLEGAEMLQLLQRMCSDLITPTCEQ